MDAAELFETVIHWLREHYADYRFFTERDIVWTVQLRLHAEIASRQFPFRVVNDYTMTPGIRADLAILERDAVAVAAEFKYEPDPARSSNRGGDIWHSKLPVINWPEAAQAVERARNYAAQGQAKTAYSIVIDEGGHYNWRPPPAGCQWQDWGNGRWALWSRQCAPDHPHNAP